MPRMTVKLNIHDWPKRGSFMRETVEVDAVDDMDAMAKAVHEANQRWPDGKAKAFDVVRSRLMASVAMPPAEENVSREAIEAAHVEIVKRGPGRPRKDEVRT